MFLFLSFLRLKKEIPQRKKSQTEQLHELLVYETNNN